MPNQLFSPLWLDSMIRQLIVGGFSTACMPLQIVILQCMVPDRQNLDQNNPEQQPNVSLNNNSDQCLSSITLLFWCQGIKDWRRFFNKAFGYSVHPLVSLSILYEGPPRWSLTSHYQIWLSTATYVGFNHVRPIRTCQAPYIGPTQALTWSCFVIW